MNLDELRSALHEPALVPLAVDLDRVLRRGRRRVVARRAAVPVAALSTAAAIAVPTLLQPQPRSDLEAAAPGPTTAPPVAAGCVSTDVEPWGEVIRTGDFRADRERVYWFSRVTKPPLRAAGSRFILVAGWRAADGSCTLAFSLSQDPPEYTAGFHGIYTSTGAPGGPTVPAGDWSAVGWYVGPAASVTATLNGTVLRARLARWSVQEWPVTLFWFSADTAGAPARVAVGTRLTGLAAYDAQGARLPAGDTTPDGDTRRSGNVPPGGN